MTAPGNVSALTVRGATRRFGARLAVDGVDLDLHAGRITALLGPSGCGKSTLLRMIAGLEPMDDGTIHAEGRMLADTTRSTSPEARAVGLVFQDYALFPHLNVADNVAFGLKDRPRAERRRTALEWLDTVHLADRADAWPHMLSGGEQQRVALVRALARRPHTVLLDEPFSGLDRHLKSEVRQTLMGSLRAAGAAVLMVTHDAEEALLMADDLALMDKGRILQTGAPDDAYLQPVSPAAARLLGEAELLSAEVRAGVATTAFGPLPAPDAPDGPAWVMIRPGDAIVSMEGAAATVVAVAFGGPFIEVNVQAGGQTLRLRTTGPAPSIGEAIRVTLDADRARFYPRP
ncbi:ABC transporter ATP-binding protein [Brevundimonas diminuta]|uniref:ABC transporter ATP-binding protein n=1 Tax=Brevundimonas diminuta TaxID=293 RepID=UPI000B4DF5EA|nr:ABC transporter ATP-binding protein [Brevundimonas diminuta]OWR20515.1 ABC transporter [Brevundimonas diminuta]WQE46713.1 ABC transporter ATP-binding protein [Brevundimonas diminuta]SUW15972.1 Fe(3+) ions import ATP-binding protein FbpC 2 [Brevundimonas diminuta]